MHSYACFALCAVVLFFFPFKFGFSQCKVGKVDAFGHNHLLFDNELEVICTRDSIVKVKRVGDERHLCFIQTVVLETLLWCHSFRLHLWSCCRAAQWCELDWHWYYKSAWWSISLHAILCQRLFFNQWRYTADSAVVAGTFHTGF